MEAALGDRVVKWNRIVFLPLGLVLGIGGAAFGLTKGQTVLLILASCAALLGAEYVVLRKFEDHDA